MHSSISNNRLVIRGYPGISRDESARWRLFQSLPLHRSVAVEFIHGCLRRGQQHRLSTRPKASATQAVVQVFINTPIGQLPAATLSNLLQSSGVFVLCICLGIFLIASIPCLWSMARAAYRAEAVLKVVQEELPHQSALLRLSGLEVVEAVSEMSRLGSDLSSGVRSIANLATETEQGIKLGISGTEAAINKGLVPALAKAEGSLREAMEAELLQRARLNHTKEAIEGLGRAAEAAARAARRARVGVQAARLAVGAGSLMRRVMERAAETNISKLRRSRGSAKRIDVTQSVEE